MVVGAGTGAWVRVYAYAPEDSNNDFTRGTSVKCENRSVTFDNESHRLYITYGISILLSAYTLYSDTIV